MAKEVIVIDLDLSRQQILNYSLQNLSTFPDPGPNAEGISMIPGFVFWHTGDNTAYAYTGSGWLNLGAIYSHPSFPTPSFPANATTGATIISKITLTNGHVTGIETRDITPADISAAAAVHTHAFSQVTGLPGNTILGNKTGAPGPAQTLTVSELMTIMGIAYGQAAMLAVATGTDTEQRTWSAKMIADYVTAKIAAYVVTVNLSYTASATQGVINNSAGSNAVIPAGSSTNASLMLPADKVKLDAIQPGANAYSHPNDYVGPNDFSTLVSSGVKILSHIVVNSLGHVVSVKGRNLTTADLAAVMIDDAVNNATDKTWSSNKIYTTINSIIAQAQTGALVYQTSNYIPSVLQGQVVAPTPTSDTTIKTGMVWVVSSVGWFGNDPVEPGDMIIANTNSAGTTASNYQVINKNIPAIVDATQLVSGIVRLATQSDYDNSDNSTAVTPLLLRNVLHEKTGTHVVLIGDGTSTSFTVDHPLNSNYVTIKTQRVSDDAFVRTEVKPNGPSQVKIDMNIPPATNSLRVIIKK